MTEQQATRQLVKSAPELWAQCSDAALLGKHLNREIRITRLEPESTVVWEGEAVCGTVTLEASGWGTRVRLTALGARTGSGAPSAAEDAPVAVVPPLRLAPTGIAGLLNALRGRRGAPVRASDAAPTANGIPAATANGTPTATAATTPAPSGSPDLVAELEAALDSLGQAHHRPYSRG